VIEEADVVIPLLQRPDLVVDELVERAEISGEFVGEFEVHGLSS
jgi:hypothetical protein